ncbi:soluble epoxide hydrolase [Candidatus Phycosocius bacilliformis]|uniref:Soluble epoxide hydrolase n=1 Tax=Candidatus Phycosocius bacilliformis TaxID=1445552 RepID=A0A2P2EE12_9PROT|nr:epoxide hydrolase family protein [Candidatus Phycosocius bacilliformis]GBF59300.1 soluble epoxide hydrolase [Candidatus Phycosocius bacilliformis]
MKISPFSIAISDEKLAAVWQKVADFTWPDTPEGEAANDWTRGAATDWLKDFQRFWLAEYNWRAVEAELNRWAQFQVTIDGQDLHFLHVVGEAGGKRPLLLTHGWPGSVFEFHKVIEPLAFPSRHGGSSDDAFDLIIPSLPGYSFSGRPSQPIGPRTTAGLWRKLMVDVLGYRHFLAQGGDWGSVVTAWLGLDHADVVSGIHLNMLGLRPDVSSLTTPERVAWAQKSAAMMQAHGAYFHLQTTRPQMLAMALSDTPFGQAAWILEKFQAWSDPAGGGLDAVFGKKDLLTNILHYVLTDRFATSVWFYRGVLEEGSGYFLPKGTRIDVPTGFANFPGDKVYPNPPRDLVAEAYNLRHWSNLARGGHFAAWEAPDLFAEDLARFGRTIGA